MAFESYRNQTRPGAARRRVMFLVAALLHGGLISGGVAYSYWHVDELTAPTLRVTFISAAPPPPPPPPPPAGSGGKKKVAQKPKTPEIPLVTPKPTEIVQPRERPAPVKQTFRKHDDEEEEEDEPAGVKGGVKGGISGGTIGGTVGGTIGGTVGGTIGGVVGTPLTAAPKFLPPQMGALQKESGDDPFFPPSLNHGGLEYIVQAKICVSRAGAVETVTLVKKADALLDDSVLSAVRKWRFRPLVANGNAVPFCYFGRFEFKSRL